MVDVVVERVTDVVVERAEGAVAVVTEALQGPPGPPGPPGPAGGASIIATAATPIGGDRFVFLDAAGAPQYADARTPAHAHSVVGMTLGAADAGQPVSIIRSGEVQEPAWAWEAGAPVFLGANGVPTQAPLPDAAFCLVVGFATAPTRLFVSINPPIVLT